MYLGDSDVDTSAVDIEEALAVWNKMTLGVFVLLAGMEANVLVTKIFVVLRRIARKEKRVLLSLTLVVSKSKAEGRGGGH